MIRLLQQNLGVSDDGIIGPQTLGAFAKKYGKTKAQTAHFFANVHHETGGFRVREENLNYTSAERIRSVWPSRFPTTASAQPFVRNPEGLANRVYSGRMGNNHHGDGWKYRGRGALQLTGKNNYLDFMDYIDDTDVLCSPGVVADKYYWESALYFFDRNNVWSIATDISENSIKNVRRRINGGLNGIDDVIRLIKTYYR